MVRSPLQTRLGAPAAAARVLVVGHVVAFRGFVNHALNPGTDHLIPIVDRVVVTEIENDSPDSNHVMYPFMVDAATERSSAQPPLDRQTRGSLPCPKSI